MNHYELLFISSLMLMIKEYSYGVIPLYKDKDGHVEILVVKGLGYRGFPKGHIEEGEMPVDAAIRELQEETGLKKVTVDEGKMFKDHYIFTQKKKIISKHVGYFVAYAADKRITLQKDELNAYRWVSLPDARNLLTFDSAKKILDDVFGHLGYEKYLLTVLPDDLSLTLLNSLKQYFYVHGFRYENKKSASDVHITLTQILCAPSQLQSVYLKLKSALRYVDSFPLSCNKIINKLHKADSISKRYPKGMSWIALSFADVRLKRIAREVIAVCKTLGVDDTVSYMQRIRDNRIKSAVESDYMKYIALKDPVLKYPVLKYLANHMNICNYAKSEKAQEIVRLSTQRMPKIMSIDKVALRNFNGRNEWIIPLKNSPKGLK